MSETSLVSTSFAPSVSNSTYSKPIVQDDNHKHTVTTATVNIPCNMVNNGCPNHGAIASQCCCLSHMCYAYPHFPIHAHPFFQHQSFLPPPAAPILPDPSLVDEFRSLTAELQKLEKEYEDKINNNFELTENFKQQQQQLDAQQSVLRLLEEESRYAEELYLEQLTEVDSLSVRAQEIEKEMIAQRQKSTNGVQENSDTAASFIEMMEKGRELLLNIEKRRQPGDDIPEFSQIDSDLENLAVQLRSMKMNAEDYQRGYLKASKALLRTNGNTRKTVEEMKDRLTSNRVATARAVLAYDAVDKKLKGAEAWVRKNLIIQTKKICSRCGERDKGLLEKGHIGCCCASPSRLQKLTSYR